MANAATLEITSSKFSNNRAGLDGGAIACNFHKLIDGNPRHANDITI